MNRNKKTKNIKVNKAIANMGNSNDSGDDITGNNNNNSKTKK